MELKRFAPWNWFKKENNGSAIAVKHGSDEGGGSRVPLAIWQDEMNRLFDDFGFGVQPFGSKSQWLEGISGSMLKPRLDLGANDKFYTVSIEIPGVNEKDITLEQTQDTLIIRGEKKQEKEEKKQHFYRMERSYGAFQRTLSLPGDANRDKIKAAFKNGVLNITIPRKEPTGSRSRQVEIHYA